MSESFYKHATRPESATSDLMGESRGTLYQQMGGPSGLIMSTVPILIIIFGTKRLGLSVTLIAALVVAFGYLAYCVFAKKTIQPAISGIIGVVIGVVIAWITGEAKGFFLYGIWMSALYAVLFVISIVVRWPAVGLIWLGINGHGTRWRSVKKARIFYDVATALWAIVFAARFFVQHWLYDKNATDALGWAKILMGWPLTAITIAATVWLVSRAGRIIDEHEKETGEVILKTAKPDKKASDVEAGEKGKHLPIDSIADDPQFGS